MIAIQILTNATSGNSSEFQLPDGSITFRLRIVGASSNPINAYFLYSEVANNIYLKISGVTDSGAIVNLQAKTNNPGDDFNDTGQSFNKDYGGTHYLQSRS